MLTLRGRLRISLKNRTAKFGESGVFGWGQLRRRKLYSGAGVGRLKAPAAKVS